MRAGHLRVRSTKKVDILFCLMSEFAKAPQKRPKIISRHPMSKLAQKNIKVTLRNGHILYGIPIEYNFTMNANNRWSSSINSKSFLKKDKLTETNSESTLHRYAKIEYISDWHRICFTYR